MPITAFTLTISLFALAGVPLSSGFMSKLILFTAAVDGGLWWLRAWGPETAHSLWHITVGW